MTDRQPLLLVVFLCLVMASASTVAQDLPHAFPRDGARQLLDNDRVTIWDVTWIKGKPSPMHRHRYDLVGVYLVGSEIEIIYPDGRSIVNTMDHADVIFQPKDVTHIESGTVAVNPRRAILIDVKEFEASSPSGESEVPSAFPRDGATKRLENDRVVIWDYRWTAGSTTPMHHHDRDSVVVFLEDGALRSTTPDDATAVVEMAPGHARFSVAGRTHSEELIRGTGRAIVVELK